MSDMPTINSAELPSRNGDRPIVILGSCVTRDAIELQGHKSRLHYYHARSNLASMTYATPLKEMPQLNITKGFEARCAVEDMTKTIDFAHKGKMVIFDFIDDRMPIARKDGACFTYNWRILAGGSDDIPLVRHFVPHYRPQMRKIIHKFYEKNNRLFHGNRIVLHKAKYNSHYDGARPSPQALAAMNSHFDFLFKEILSTWKVDGVIDLNHLLDRPSATPRDHRWGHKPFHYCDAYQQALADRISEELLKLPVR